MKLLLALVISLPLCGFASVIIRPSVNEGFFVCNAGIAHKALTGSVCVSQKTGLTCSASEDTLCACSDAQAGGDSLVATWDDLTVADSSPVRHRANTVMANAQGTYATLFSDLNAWNNNVTSVQINSSSEVYGTSYFVDFCYQGPIAKLEKQNGRLQDSSEGIYDIDAGITAQSLANTVSYTTDANLAMSLSVNCDLRNAGKYKDARTATQFAPDGNALEADMSFGSSGYPRSNSLSVSQRLNSNVQLVPRFCSVRAIFTEMSGVNSLKVRPQTVNPTQFTVDLDISSAGSIL